MEDLEPPARKRVPGSSRHFGRRCVLDTLPLIDREDRTVRVVHRGRNDLRPGAERREGLGRALVVLEVEGRLDVGRENVAECAQLLGELAAERGLIPDGDSDGRYRESDSGREDYEHRELSS